MNKIKSQLNKFRQYTISDYLLNMAKFKDYLKFCQQNNLKKEKKYIIENLFRTLQFKENCGNSKLLSELKKLCISTIIFSDFEIELLFDLECFNPGMQKNVFYEIQNYLNKAGENDNDNINEEIKKIINYKFNYWMLKLQNQNLISINEVKDSILMEKEVIESVEKLTNYINIEKDSYKNKNKNEKIFMIKIIYELVLYYYFKNDNEKSFQYLNNLICYYKDFLETYNINSNKDKLFYFDIEKIKYLYNYIEKTIKKNKNDFIIESNNNNLIIDNNDNNNNIDLNNNLFIMESIDNYDNVINDDYNKYKNEIDKTNKEYLEKITSNNENSLNSCDLSNKNCVNSLMTCLKITEFFVNFTLEDFSKYNIGINFLNLLKSKAELKIQTNTIRKEENDLQYIKKEIYFYSIMFQLIEYMINNTEKLPTSFFKNLSEYITNNTLTGNLRISGLIHSNIINFSLNIKTFHSYFNAFMTFFNGKTSVYKKETINQITFIGKVVEIIYQIIDMKKTIHLPLDKEIIININENLHIELINIFLYWLSSDDSNEEDIKADSNNANSNKKKSLKYNPSINIIYILLESLRNIEYLKIYRIIVSKVLEFLVSKKHLNEVENKSDIFEYIYEIKARLFKISNIFDGVVRNTKVLMDDTIYYINLKINFVESAHQEQYLINNDCLNFHIKTLFEIIKKIDRKIYKYESVEKINELNYNENNMNYNQNIIIDNTEIINRETKNYNDILFNKKDQFLSSFYYILEVNTLKHDNEIKMTIINGINYLQFSMEQFKIAYMKNDLMNDFNKIKKSYEAFKSSLNQDILYQLILCFVTQKRYLEGVILIQYSKKFESVVAYKLLKNICEKNEFIKIECFKYIWKMCLFEYLANYFYNSNNHDALAKIKTLIKRVSNHQFFKGHLLRKNFKIVNFLDFLDYLNNIKYNC